MCTLSSVPFHGDTILCVEKDGEPYIPIRRIVENLGLGWGSQSIKISKAASRLRCFDIETPTEGGVQSMLCIPLKKLPAYRTTTAPPR